MTTALPTPDEAPAWLPTRDIPIQRVGSPVSAAQATAPRSAAPTVAAHRPPATMFVAPAPAAPIPRPAGVAAAPGQAGHGQPGTPAPTSVPSTTTQPARGNRAALGGLAAGLTVGALGALVAAVLSGPATVRGVPAHGATVPTPVRAANVSVPSRTLTAFGDGTWQVGVDVEPGTYTTTGAAGTGCYHGLRTAATGGATQHGGVSRGPATVVLTADDGWFETFGCATWNRVG